MRSLTALGAVASRAVIATVLVAAFGCSAGNAGGVPPDTSLAGRAAAAARAASLAPAGSPVALHGTLTARGNRIVGDHGRPMQLKGVSLFWSHESVGSVYYNEDAVDWLVSDWKIQIIRAAIGVTGQSGVDYLADPAPQLQLLDNVVHAAVKNGIYVLIDWHDHHAPDHADAAAEFFRAVSRKYGHHPNVVYEIWNEPLGNESVTWSGNIRPYADMISAQIRPNDPSNLMIVGTPFWDQQPDAALGDPVNDVNVAYSLHFYAGSPDHAFAGGIGRAAQAALDGGLPLLVTEWGTVDPINQSLFNEAETRTWMAFLDANKISSCNWSIANKVEGAAALMPTADPHGGWTEAELTASGRLVRSLIRGE